MNRRIAVLHLEDNPRDSELVQACLESGGLTCDLELVRTGEQFASKIAMFDYDVILSDFTMPGFSGMDALAVAQRIAPHTPFIFVSGTIGEELAVESLTKGACDYILKHRPKRLPSAVQRAIEDAERKQEQAKGLAYQRFQADLLGNVNEALFVVDSMETIAYWNSGASDLFEFDGVTMIGQRLEEADDFCGCDFFRELTAKRKREGEYFDVLCEFKSGKKKWISAKYSRVHDSAHPRELDLYVAVDASERKEFETKILMMNQALEQRIADRTMDLESMNEELRAFSYSVSHDLQAPLRVVSAYSRLLLEDHGSKLDEEGRGYVSRIMAACVRMDNLIAGLLHLATVSREQLVRKSVDLSELATIVAQELVALQPDRIVEVDVHDGLRVFADERLLRSLMENLVGNAVKFTSSREVAKIVVGQAIHEEKTSYFVRDNGIGFSPEQAHNIFTPFNRLNTDSEYAGHGIGLATANRIVAKHGGVMKAEGEPDKGATFYFSLP